MSGETPTDYSEKVLEIVDMYSTLALQTQHTLDSSASAAAVLGSIMEEFNDRHESIITSSKQAFGDAFHFLTRANPAISSFTWNRKGLKVGSLHMSLMHDSDGNSPFSFTLHLL